MIHVLMVGGGSAGHIAPMVAVAEALHTIDPTIQRTFVCSDRSSDGAFLAMEGYAYDTLPLPRRSLAFPLLLLQGFMKSMRLLAQQQPDVIFSKGGAVSVPLCTAAFLRRIPIVVHESDTVMGMANRMTAIVAKRVCLGWTRAGSGKRFIVTGNPIRTRILQGNRNDGLRITGLSGTRPILLVMGGSQGALSINQVVASHLDALLAIVDIIHLTGQRKAVAVSKPGYYATEFGSDMLPHFYACANLALSRSGASSIAELAAWNIPTILVPLHGVAGNHQVKNAEAAAAHLGMTHLPQAQLDATVVSIVRSFAVKEQSHATMEHPKRYAPRTEAARLVAETVVQSVARTEAGA